MGKSPILKMSSPHYLKFHHQLMIHSHPYTTNEHDNDAIFDRKCVWDISNHAFYHSHALLSPKTNDTYTIYALTSHNVWKICKILAVSRLITAQTEMKTPKMCSNPTLLIFETKILTQNRIYTAIKQRGIWAMTNTTQLTIGFCWNLWNATKRDMQWLVNDVVGMICSVMSIDERFDKWLYWDCESVCLWHAIDL